MYVKYCPKCKGIILPKGIHHTERDSDTVIEVYHGYCIKCNKQYQWEGWYVWSFDTEPEEK